MPSDDRTRRYRRFTAMVLVSERGDNVELCRRCAEELQVLCKHCGLDEAAHTATQWRPFALLVDEVTCEEAVPELAKLAQIVEAQLIVLTGTMSADREGSLMPALKAAFKRAHA